MTEKKSSGCSGIFGFIILMIFALFSSCLDKDNKSTSNYKQNTTIPSYTATNNSTTNTKTYSTTNSIVNTNTSYSSSHNNTTTTNSKTYIPEPEKNPYSEYDEYYDDLRYDYYGGYDGYDNHYDDWIDEFGEEYEVRGFQSYDDYYEQYLEDRGMDRYEEYREDRGGMNDNWNGSKYSNSDYYTDKDWDDGSDRYNYDDFLDDFYDDHYGEYFDDDERQ